MYLSSWLVVFAKKTLENTTEEQRKLSAKYKLRIKFSIGEYELNCCIILPVLILMEGGGKMADCLRLSTTSQLFVFSVWQLGNKRLNIAGPVKRSFQWKTWKPSKNDWECWDVNRGSNFNIKLNVIPIEDPRSDVKDKSFCMQILRFALQSRGSAFL